ncbi:hypothetical protein AAG906_036839 [Vitis piasezkii]
MKNQALELHSPLPKSFKVCKERTMEKRKTKDNSCSLLSHFWSTSKSIFTIYHFKALEAKLASMARRIEEFELRNVHTEAQPQAMPTSFEYNNHPNLTTQPQPQPSMSTSSLEQAILKISKVMEDFGVYNDLSLRIEKVQDSIEKLTNLDIARGKRKLPPQPHHNLQGTNAKRSRKVLKIDTLVGIAMTTLLTNLPLKIIRYDAYKNRSYGENKGKQGGNNCWAHFDHFPKLISCVLYLVSNLGNRTHFATVGHIFWSSNYVVYLLNSKSTSHEVPLPSSLFLIQTLRTMFISLWQSFWKLKFMKNQALELHSPLPKSFKVCKERTMEKRKTKDSSCSLLSHFWSTFRSPFFTYYIPFQSSGSQESNYSNHARFGAEMRKIWPSEDNCSRLCENFITPSKFA